MSTLKHTFERLLPELKGSIFDYSDPKQFAELWSLSPTGQKLLIIWPFTPYDETLAPVNTAPCVSPLELAACLTKAIGDDPREWPQIAILDLNPRRNSTAPLYRFFCRLEHERYPWLNVVQAADLFPISGVAAPMAPKTFLGSLINHWIRKRTVPGALFKAQPTGDPERLDSIFFADSPILRTGVNISGDSVRQLLEGRELLLQHVRSKLTETGKIAEFDRHAISNIIGPMILAGGRPVLEKSIHSEPLQSVVRSVELSSHGPSIGKLVTDLNIVFLDDQAHHGWECWLRFLMQPQQSTASLTVLRDPTTLVRILGTQFNALPAELRSMSAPLRFRLNLAPGDEVDRVLLLDLRLFSGRMDAEVVFLRESLIPLAKKIAEHGHFKETTHIDDSLINIIENGLKSPKEEERRDACWRSICLLPKVLAALDFSIPVIILSSTHDERVISELRLISNVVAILRKPAIHAAETVDLVSQLQHAFDLAAKWIALRRKARLLITFAEEQRKTLADIEAGRALAEAPHVHIEIYLDESGNGPLSVGGVFALYLGQTDKECVELADAFDESLVRDGLLYYDLAPLWIFSDGSSQPRILTKKEGCWKPVEAAVRRFKNKVFLGFVRLDTSEEANKATGEDRVHRDAVSHLLEILLCNLSSVLGCLNPKVLLSTSVFAAARSAPLADASEALSEHYKSGLNIYWRKDWFLKSFGHEVLRLILGELWHLHASAYPRLDRSASHDMPYRVNDPQACPQDWRLKWSASAAWEDLAFPAYKKRNAGQFESLIELEQRIKYEVGISDDGCVRPDVRALQYLADEVLGIVIWPGNQRLNPRLELVLAYETLLSDATNFGGFDDILGDHLRELACRWREWHCGEKGKAIAALSLVRPQTSSGYSHAHSALWMTSGLWLAKDCDANAFYNSVRATSKGVASPTSALSPFGEATADSFWRPPETSAFPFTLVGDPTCLQQLNLPPLSVGYQLIRRECPSLAELIYGLTTFDKAPVYKLFVPHHQMDSTVAAFLDRMQWSWRPDRINNVYIEFVDKAQMKGGQRSFKTNFRFKKVFEDKSNPA